MVIIYDSTRYRLLLRFLLLGSFPTSPPPPPHPLHSSLCLPSTEVESDFPGLLSYETSCEVVSCPQRRIIGIASTVEGANQTWSSVFTAIQNVRPELLQQYENGNVFVFALPDVGVFTLFIVILIVS